MAKTSDTKKTAVKKTTAKKADAKKPAAKKTTSTNATAKKITSKKSQTRKTTTASKKTAEKKATAKKAVAKKAIAKEPAAKKTTVTKATAKKTTTVKKAVAKKIVAKPEFKKAVAKKVTASKTVPKKFATSRTTAKKQTIEEKKKSAPQKTVNEKAVKTKMDKKANEKTKANIGFEKQLWGAACVLWGHIPAAEYRKVIVGLIFLRYISAAFNRRYQELVEEGEGFEDDRDAYSMENVFFVPEEARWEKIAAAAHTPEIGTVIDNAMRAIESENRSLKNVLPKNYASPDLDKRVLGDVVDIFTNSIDMGDTEESEDLLGRTYEYCIAQFAEKEGVGGGEFYTPASVVKTLVAVLKPFDNCRVYDPCCGSGGMFVQSAKFIKAHSGKRGAIAVYGQEANADTWKMAKMNMAIRGIDADFGPYQADTFTSDLHPTLKADFVLANPPFNYHPWNQEKLLDDVRWKYGIPPAGNANYAWIQHMIHHLAPNGKIGLVLANGALSTQSSGEGEIRKKIIEDDLIEGIIAMPTQLFYSVTIPVTLWFITKGKKQKGKTLFIDARKMGHMVDRKHRDLDEEDIQKLADTFEAFQNGKLEDVKGFCSIATLQDIEKQDYILTPGRYVGIEEQEDDGEPFEEKMTRLTSELSDMFVKSHELEDEIRRKLGAIGYEV